MKKYTLQPLSELDKSMAVENHNLIYGFLHRYGYSIDEYYNIAVFGFLHGIQVYNRRNDLQKKYNLAFIICQYMRSEIRNHLKAENAQKRKPKEKTISLDADYVDKENLYNIIGGKSAEVEVIEKELITEIMKKFSKIQRKIVQMKIEGYSNKEVYLMAGMKPSTYYKEMKRIVENVLKI